MGWPAAAVQVAMKVDLGRLERAVAAAQQDGPAVAAAIAKEPAPVLEVPMAWAAGMSLALLAQAFPQGEASSVVTAANVAEAVQAGRPHRAPTIPADSGRRRLARMA